MINIAVSTLINRPITEVFPFVADFANLPKWETDILEVKPLSSAPVGVGTAFQCVLKMPGRAAPSRFEITAYTANREVAFAGTAAGPAKPKGSFQFEPVGEGTRVTARPQPELRGFFKLLEPLMAGYIKRQNEAHLANLKRLLEGAPRQ